MNLFDQLDQVGRQASTIEGLTAQQHPEYRETLIMAATELCQKLSSVVSRIPAAGRLPSWERAMLFQKTYLVRDRLDRALTVLNRERIDRHNEIIVVQRALRLAHEVDFLMQQQYQAAA